MTAHPITPETPIPANTKVHLWHKGCAEWLAAGPYDEPVEMPININHTHWRLQPDAPERTLSEAESKASHEAFVVYKAALNSADVFEADFTEGFLAALKYNESLSK